MGYYSGKAEAYLESSRTSMIECGFCDNSVNRCSTGFLIRLWRGEKV